MEPTERVELVELAPGDYRAQLYHVRALLLATLTLVDHDLSVGDLDEDAARRQLADDLRGLTREIDKAADVLAPKKRRRRVAKG
jgi:hypothetical protein